MPIRDDRMALYPGGSTSSPEWREIRARIQQRAGDCCEGCRLANGAIGIRVAGEFIDLPGWAPGDVVFILGWHEGIGLADIGYKAFRIVCTVAHVDRELVDHSDGNLRFWCQQCHNRHDAAARAARAAATRASAKPLDLLAWMAAQGTAPGG